MAIPLRSVQGPLHASDYNTVQVVVHSTSQDVSFNASGGAVVTAGPFDTSVIRIAIADQQAIRIAFGPSGTTVSATGPLFVGPGVEHVAINPGWYLAAISDDGVSGTFNVTEAL